MYTHFSINLKASSFLLKFYERIIKKDFSKDLDFQTYNTTRGIYNVA